MDNIYGELDASIQAKIEADVDFQNEIVELPDEERTAKVNEKKIDLFNLELAEMKKAKELAENYKIRAEKAEKAVKPATKDEDPSKKTDGFSLKDIRALNNVHDEDIDDVLDYAKYKGVTPAEALKSPAIVSLLKTKEEERKTAMASNTGAAKRGNAHLSDEKVLQDFQQGRVPEKDDDIARLAEARHNQRKNKK